MSGPAVAASGLGKRFPGAGWVLRGVDFELPAGSVLGVVGENGSGKSTLLDLLLGVARPSEGGLRVEGRAASLLELGAGFFLELTGRENAELAFRVSGAGRREARDRALAVAEFAELGESFDRPVCTYSAGMAMRLGFAVAASLEAPVVLIDEVLAVGDGYFQRKCIDRVVGLRRSGVTLVIASHDLHALKSLCDVSLWLRQGRPEALGPAGEVLGRYEEHLRRRAALSAGLAPGRRGTGQAAILDVRLRDETGAEIGELRTGQTLRVEVTFEARQPLESPIMGVALFRDDGVYCAGPNTGFDGCLQGRYEGRYLLSAEFPQLPLLAGAYEISVSIYDKDHVYAYAWDHRLYPLRVVSDRPEHGLVLLPHRFSVRRAEA